MSKKDLKKDYLDSKKIKWSIVSIVLIIIVVYLKHKIIYYH